MMEFQSAHVAVGFSIRTGHVSCGTSLVRFQAKPRTFYPTDHLILYSIIRVTVRTSH